MKILLFCVAVALVLMNCVPVNSQTFYSPISGITASNFTSAFGPRNVTSNGADYPDQGYKYDFHAAIDIGSPSETDVMPVADGIVKNYSTLTYPDYYVEVEHTHDDGAKFLVRYYHIQPTAELIDAIDNAQSYSVTGGSTILGKILVNHLDIRYYPNGVREDHDKNADNPGKILTGVSENTFNSCNPVFVNESGNPMPSTTLNTESDDGTAFGNPAGAEFFSAGVQIDRTALSVNLVDVWLSAVDGANLYYDEQLLDNVKNDPQSPEYGMPGAVWYYSDGWWLRTYYPDHWRLSCGDLKSKDEDNGHIGKTVGIYPKDMKSQNTTHTVYFRWYINAPLWSELKDRNVRVYADFFSEAWGGDCLAEIDNIEIATCIDCPHPTGVPDAPNLTSASYDSHGPVNLVWTQSGSNTPKFYKIYRCPASRDITDLDAVGISSTTGYADSDMQLQPGTQYKYAVAGVNERGEGPNSNSRTVTYGQELPSSITSSRTLSGGWYTTSSVTVSSGATVTITPGTRFAMGPGCSFYSYGKILAGGSGNPIVFGPFNQTPSPGCWGSFVLSGAGASNSNLNNFKFNYGTQIDVLNNASFVTISNCNITNNSGHGINASNCSYLTISDNTIANSNVNHGILINGGYTNNCYRNVIYKINHNRQGAGIQYGGANGTIEKNDIDYYNWGIAGIWGADIHGGNSSNNGWNNRVANGKYGLLIYRQSNGEFGSMGNPASGFNSIYGNTYYNAAVGMSYPTYSCLVYAEYNWWGANPPDASKLYTGSASTSYFWYPRSSDPWGSRPLPSYDQFIAGNPTGLSFSTSSLPETEYAGPSDGDEIQKAMPVPNGEDSLSIGAMLKTRHKDKEAMDFFISYIKRHPGNQAAYVMLNSCADSQTTPAIIDFFKSLPAQASREHRLLLANLYLRQNDVKSAKEVNDGIIRENKNTPLGTRAKMNNLYISLYSENDPETALSILKEIKRNPKLTTGMELSTAEWALKSYVDPNTGDMPYSNSADASGEQLEAQLPEEGGMIQNYPNPFNPTTAISYRIPASGMVELKVYDVLGREVATLLKEYQKAGVYTAYFNGQNLASGIYFCRLTAPGISQIKKMLMVK